MGSKSFEKHDVGAKNGDKNGKVKKNLVEKNFGRNRFRMFWNVFQNENLEIEIIFHYQFLVRAPDSINGDGSAAAGGGSLAHLLSTPQRVILYELMIA